jgi:hypothetical protein
MQGPYRCVHRPGARSTRTRAAASNASLRQALGIEAFVSSGGCLVVQALVGERTDLWRTDPGQNMVGVTERSFGDEPRMSDEPPMVWTMGVALLPGVTYLAYRAYRAVRKLIR